MIDIVIPLGNGSIWDNNELRYSLRSIEKHLKNYRNIYIIGIDLNWVKYSNLKYICIQDYSHIPSKNIKDKLLLACNNKNVSDNFLYWNDDYFLLKDLDATKVPFYHGGDLKPYIDGCSYTNWYRKYLEVTYNTLLEIKAPTKNFDIHYPSLINKDSFKRTMEIIFKRDWNDNKELLIKSLYYNINQIQGEYLPDYKLKEAKSLGELITWKLDKFMISVGTNGLNESFKFMLNELFPNKSKYEL